jgi:hypothetical protein
MGPGVEVLGVIPKTDRAEVRVTRQRCYGRGVVDIRACVLTTQCVSLHALGSD